MANQTFEQRVSAFAGGGVNIEINSTATGQADNIVTIGSLVVFTNPGLTKITGFAGGTNNKVLEIAAAGSIITLSALDSGSSVGNQLIPRGNVSRTLYPGDTARFIYFSAYNAWLEITDNIEQGAFTPTIYTDLNVTTVSPSGCQKVRFGSEILVRGAINATPSAAGKVQIGISLPLANLAPPTLAVVSDIVGSGAVDDGTAVVPVQILADVTNQRAQMTLYANNTNPLVIPFEFRFRGK